MAEPQDRREPQPRRRGVRRAHPSLRRRQRCQFGVGARQHDDVSRTLGEVDRRRTVGDRPRHRRQQVHSAAQRRGDRGAVEPFLADHDKACRAGFAGQPRPVEIMLHPVADRLHDLAPVAAGQVDKALDPQYVMRGDRGAQPAEKAGAVADRAQGHDKAVEIVMVVGLSGIVQRRARGEVVLGRGGETERDLPAPPPRRGRRPA